MKLGSLKEGGRDGTLVVVSRDLSTAVRATGIAPTLQRALEDWSNVAPRLNALYESLNGGDADGAFDVDFNALAAPLPRAYEFVDGSAYLPHVERVRRARNAEVPASFYTDPLMYQATGAGFHGPRDPVKVVSEDYGIDLEAEIVVVTDDVPMAVTPNRPRPHQLVGLVNDVSLRNLIPAELAKGFGFLQSSRVRAVAGVRDARRTRRRLAGQQLHLPLLTHINGEWFGAGGGRRHAVQLRPTGRPCSEDAPLSAAPSSARHHRQRGYVQGSVVLRREAHRRNAARRQAFDAFHVLRRHGAHRDAGPCRRQHLRRDRTTHRAPARPLRRRTAIRPRWAVFHAIAARAKVRDRHGGASERGGTR